MKNIIILFSLLLLTAGVCRAQTSLERGVVEEMNHARTKPQQYAQFLKDHRRLYKGSYIILPRSNVRIATAEGVGAVDEAIRFLLKQKPLGRLEASKGLAGAAADLVRDQSRSGDTGHYGRSSGSMGSRIERHGTWQGSIGENIGYGFDDPRWVVMQLIIDDGVRGRGHRKNIFNPAFKRVGVACGPHAVYGSMCVTDFAEGFSR